MSMKNVKKRSLSLADVDVGSTTATADRKSAEHEAQRAVKIDGRNRRKLGDRLQVIYRMTPEKKRQLDALAEARGKSYSETMSDALDALEDKLRGPRST
jgi:hypothetical protein